MAKLLLAFCRLEIGDTADLEICATLPFTRLFGLSRYSVATKLA
jgi:hypothetical protein